MTEWTLIRLEVEEWLDKDVWECIRMQPCRCVNADKGVFSGYRFVACGKSAVLYVIDIMG